jgi:hypothetical protein
MNLEWTCTFEEREKTAGAPVKVGVEEDEDEEVVKVFDVLPESGKDKIEARDVLEVAKELGEVVLASEGIKESRKERKCAKRAQATGETPMASASP